MKRFDWELWETTDEDVRVVRDLIAPEVSAKSKGVRVLVKSVSRGRFSKTRVTP